MKKYIYLLCLPSLLIASGCVEKINFDYGNTDTQNYVVEASLNDYDPEFIVKVSQTSPAGEMKQLPVANCEVVIEDKLGHVATAYELGLGQYRGAATVLNQDPSSEFRLLVQTPDGKSIVSDWEKIPQSPQIQPAYYTVQNGTAPQVTFHIDYAGSSTDTKFVKFETSETWEYDMPYAIQNYYDGRMHELDSPDSHLKHCWQTTTQNDIRILSTMGLTGNNYKKFDIITANAKTPRFTVLYSLEVTQKGISESEYYFWKKIRENNATEGGLYTKQPNNIDGNLRIEGKNPQKVMGYFSVYSLKRKRFFFQTIEKLTPFRYSDCEIPIDKFSDFDKEEYPIVYITNIPNYIQIQKPCYDCTLWGGSLYKPNFWPTK
jgi:hypothetical protein